MNKLTKITLSIFSLSSLLVPNAFSSASFNTDHQDSHVNNLISQENATNVSYTIGYSIGRNMIEQLNQQNLHLCIDSLQQGFYAGIKGEKSKLSQEQMEQSMIAFQQEIESKLKSLEEND